MRETLNVKIREQLGSKLTRRLRKQGVVPAVLYGHGEANLSLSLSKDEVATAIRRGSRIVDLKGDVSDTALVRQVQWDAFGLHVMHLDLSRVSADESVEILLPIELRGTAPGIKEGGVVEHVKHEARIRCPALAIPERLELNINSLRLGASLTAGVIPLPEGATLLTDPDEIVVHCVTPMADEEELAAPAEPSEPEVIGRKKEEEGEAESEEELVAPLCRAGDAVQAMPCRRCRGGGARARWQA